MVDRFLCWFVVLLVLVGTSLAAAPARVTIAQVPRSASHSEHAAVAPLSEDPVQVINTNDYYFLKINLQDPRVRFRVLLANNDVGGYQTLQGIADRLLGQGYADWAIVNGDLHSLWSLPPPYRCPDDANCAQGLTYIDSERCLNWDGYGNTWPSRGNLRLDSSKDVSIDVGNDQPDLNQVIAGGPIVLLSGGTPTCEAQPGDEVHCGVGKWYFPYSGECFENADYWCGDTDRITMLAYDENGQYFYMGISKAASNQNMVQMAQWLKGQGAYEILRLDSGSSTGMYHNGTRIDNSTITKPIPNAFALIVENGSPPPECPKSGGVILYKNADYDCNREGEGTGYVFRSGAGWQNVGGSFNDKASSLYVPSGYAVRLYADEDRGGTSTCRTVSDPNFGGDYFDDGSTPLTEAVSSFDVYHLPYCDDPPRVFFNYANGEFIDHSGQVFEKNNPNWSFSGTAIDDRGVDHVDYHSTGSNGDLTYGASGTTDWNYSYKGLSGHNRVYFLAYDTIDLPPRKWTGS